MARQPAGDYSRAADFPGTNAVSVRAEIRLPAPKGDPLLIDTEVETVSGSIPIRNYSATTPPRWHWRHLFGIFAAGDERGHHRIFQAPRHRPFGHRHAGGHFLSLQTLHFGQVALHFFRVERGADVVGGKGRAGFVFAAKAIRWRAAPGRGCRGCLSARAGNTSAPAGDRAGCRKPATPPRRTSRLRAPAIRCPFCKMETPRCRILPARFCSASIVQSSWF